MDTGAIADVQGQMKNAETQVDLRKKGLHHSTPDTAPWAGRGHRGKEQEAERDKEARERGEGRHEENKHL